MSKSQRTKVTREIKAVLNMCHEKYGYSPQELLGRRKMRPLVKARHAAMRIMRENLGMSLPHIGGIFDIDHSSVKYACEKSTTGSIEDTEEVIIKKPVIDTSPKIISMIKVVCKTDDYVVLIGGQKMWNSSANVFDVVVTWDNARMEIISLQAAQEILGSTDVSPSANIKLGL